MHAPTPKLTEHQLATLTLAKGGHISPADGHCLLEVVSLFSGEPFGDSPACVDPVLAEFGRTWNDGLGDEDRQQLKRYIPLLPGTAKGEQLSQQRGWMAGDWLLRTHLPAWLDLAKDAPDIAALAAELRALPPITDKPGLSRAMSALDKARPALEARAAAWDAARAAAWDAARAAAWDAAWAAAWDAAWDAARDAAQKAPQDAPYGEVYTLARSAADAAVAPTQQQLMLSAHQLYLAMINAELREVAAEPAQA